MKVDRRTLPATFSPWFSRFQELTEVQRQAIPPIVAGRDVLISSATASGKTEAYAAPGAEIALQNGRPSAGVIVVTPTRALANDLKRRLEGPMSLVDLPFGRYTGEHKERVGGELASFVITTPEALDSLIARRPSSLRKTRLLVLDEVHVLDGTPRGDQLRILLHRLDRVTERRAQRVAASATVDRPAELAERYLVDAELVVVPGLRRILGRPFEGSSPAQVASHLDDLASHGFKKILAFCRSRNQVETYSAKLFNRTRYGSGVYAHHGSLARTTRERTERLFHQAPAAVCFATLTLELGIDIGTVDYVLLASVPSDVPSLLQRIGRGGRRGDETRCGFVVRQAADNHLFRTMFRLGKAGQLCATPYGFRPSVLVQQALVMASEGAYVTREDLQRAIPPAVDEELGHDAAAAILERMVELELLERSGRGRFVPSDSMEGRYRAGSLHSNIDDEPGTQVVDRMTGDIVGTVMGADTRKIELGGREREIVRISDDRLLTDASGGARPARFRPNGSPSVSLPLGRAVVESLGVLPDHVGVVTAAGATHVLHGLGTVGVLFLLELLGRDAPAVDVEETSPYTLKASLPPAEVPRPSEPVVDAFVDAHVSRLSRLVCAGPWNHALPGPLRARSIRRMTGIDEIAAFLQVAKLQEIQEPDAGLLEVLRDL